MPASESTCIEENPLDKAHFLQRQAEKSVRKHQYDEAIGLYKQSEVFLREALSKLDNPSLRHMVDVQVSDVNCQILAIRCKQQMSANAKHKPFESSAAPPKTITESSSGCAPPSEPYYMDTLYVAGTGGDVAVQREISPIGKKAPKKESSVEEEKRIANDELRTALSRLLEENLFLKEENQQLRDDNRTLLERMNRLKDKQVGVVESTNKPILESVMETSVVEDALLSAAEDLELPPLDMPDIDFESLRVG